MDKLTATNESKKSGWKALNLYLIYTAIFAAMSVLVYGYFFRNGKSLICEGDTWRQHLKAAAYYSKWLRGVLYHVFKEHSLNLQTFAFGMGYGSDLYTTLQYYALGDLLNIFSAFVKTEYIHIYFQIVMILRAYLAGITFSLYARYLRKDMSVWALLTGMFTYSFGSYFMYLGLWHPFFANPLIYLPLVLLGAEKILKENKPRFFAVAVFLAGTNNFYFFYIMVLLTIIYVVVRLIFIHFGKHQIKDAFKTIGTFFAYGVIGSLMSMFILLPILIAFPNNPRANSGIAIPLFYGEGYYKELWKNVYSFVYHGENDTQLGFTPIFVIAAIFLIIRCVCYLISRKKAKAVFQEVIFLILCTAFLCLPFIGHIFGGFSYAVNRWAFACALFAGFVTAEFADFLGDSASRMLLKRGKGDLKGVSKILTIMVFLLTLGFIIQNARSAYAPEEGNMIRDYMDLCSAEELYAQLQGTEVQVVEENAAGDGLDPSGNFYRYSGRDLVWNAAMLDGISSTQFFWSLADKSVSEYFQLMAINDQQNFAYLALDDRAVLNSIAGVRYYSLRYNTPDQQAFVPCSYAPSYEKYNFGIYENPDVMPLGFTYNTSISKTALEAMNPVQREEALLYGVVLDDDIAANYPEAEPVFTSDNIPYEVTLEGDIKESKHGYKAKAGSSLLLTFNGNPGCETLLYLKNLHIKSENALPSVTISTELADGTVINKNIDYKSEKSWYYSGWHNYVVNMGNANEAKSYLRITFNDKGTYNFDEMSVFCRSLTTMHAQLSALKEHTLTDVDLHKNPISFATNTITGSIDTDDSEILFLSVPYSKGWSAYVDGKKADLYAADTMFCAIPMSGGHHDIKLVYHTPGLFAGIILSILGLILLLMSPKLTAFINRK